MTTNAIVNQPVSSTTERPVYDAVADDSKETEAGAPIYDNVADTKEFRLQRVFKRNHFVTMTLFERKLLNNIYSWSILIRNQQRELIGKVIVTDDGRCWIFSTDNEENHDFSIKLRLMNLEANTADIGEFYNKSGDMVAKLKKSMSSLKLTSPTEDIEWGVLKWTSYNCFGYLLDVFLDETAEQIFKCQNSPIARITQSMFLKRRQLAKPYPTGDETYQEFMAQINFKEFCNSRYRLMALVPVITSNAVTCLKLYNPKYFSS